MSPLNKKIQRFIICSAIMIFAGTTVRAQIIPSPWWFGVSGAANLNWYDGTTQTLNNTLEVPTAFHKGFGVRPYASILTEYRPAGIWGFMLNVGYDGRGGKFNNVEAPCNCPATLGTDQSYVTIEPSLRIGAAAGGLYFFAGPRVAFNINKDFSYTQLRQPNVNSQFTNENNTIVSGQVGLGYDIRVSARNSTSLVSLSPFVSYQPYFGQDPRSIESWSMTTVRAGIALKFGHGHKIAKPLPPMIIPVAVDVAFSVRAPKAVPLRRQVSETLPLRNSVFFDLGSDQIPSRYVLLDAGQAAQFREAQLQNAQFDDMHGRSGRQLNVYYNILNIIGDRLKQNPNATILLSGASGTDDAHGRNMAESVKHYLVNNFGIDASRIQTEGRVHPAIPSEHPGGTRDLALLRAGDRRVDIVSTSPELLFEVGGGMMKPVQINAMQLDPLDSQVVFNVDSADTKLKSWSVEVTGDNGFSRHYGPFTDNQESIPGKLLLGDKPNGTYKVVLSAETNGGQHLRKESTVSLLRQDVAVEKGLRYSILFDFDKSNTLAPYYKFLTMMVASSIPDGAKVIIHGHTDIIGENDHNLKLSQRRAQDVKDVLQQALSAAGKNNVTFETYGFGEDPAHAPFENDTPEKRFYNRTVIVDIIPVK